MKNKSQILKDVEAEFGTKKEKFLKTIREKIAEEKDNSSFTAELDSRFLVLLDEMIQEEKEKFK